MGVRSKPIVLSELLRRLLDSWVRSPKTEQRLAERAQIVLMSASGVPNVEQAERLGRDPQRIRRWRNRWAARAGELVRAEEAGASASALEALAIDVLSDDYRSGAPARFTPEQVAQLIALACESPDEAGLPVTHWTPTELAKEAARRGIVEKISPRHVDRVLKRRRTATPQEPVLAEPKDR